MDPRGACDERRSRLRLRRPRVEDAAPLTQAASGGEGAPPKFPITGKLTKLPNAVVEVSGDDVAGSARRVGVEVDRCVQHVVTKKRELEENKFLG